MVARTPAASAGPGADAAAPPPERELFVAEGGQYRLLIESVDGGWASRRSRAVMSRRQGPASAPAWATAWQRELPHRFRPRTALAAPSGAAVLLDEWLNVRSDLAVMVIGPAGEPVAQHGLDAVLQALGVPAGAVSSKARLGVWMQSPPRLSQDGRHVEVMSADRWLRIALVEGTLGRA